MFDFADPPGFAVFDPLTHPEVWSDFASIDITPKLFKAQAHLIPRLIDLRDCGTLRRLDLQDRWAQGASGGSDNLCALLWSAASPHALASHLAERMLIRLPDGQRAWFRCLDPRVLRHCARVLDPDQKAALMGPITRWLYLDGGHAVEFAAAGLSGASACAPPLRPEQHRRLERALLVNQAEEALSSTGHAAEGSEGRSSVLDRLDHAIERAQREHGLTSAEDCVEFAVLALSVHPAFDTHARVQVALQQARSTGRGFLACVLDWTGHDWQQVAQSLDAAFAPPARSTTA